MRNALPVRQKRDSDRGGVENERTSGDFRNLAQGDGGARDFGKNFHRGDAEVAKGRGAGVVNEI